MTKLTKTINTIIFAFGINSEGMSTIIFENNTTYKIDFGTRNNHKANFNFLTHHHLDHDRFCPQTYIFGPSNPYEQQISYQFGEIPHDDKIQTYAYGIQAIGALYITDCKKIPAQLKNFAKTTKERIKWLFLELNHDANLKNLKHKENAIRHLDHHETCEFTNLVLLHHPETQLIFTHISQENMPHDTLLELQLLYPNAIFLTEPIIINHNPITHETITSKIKIG